LEAWQPCSTQLFETTNTLDTFSDAFLCTAFRRELLVWKLEFAAIGHLIEIAGHVDRTCVYFAVRQTIIGALVV
jgi:hypothetical protein